MSSCPRGGVQTWRPQGERFASGLCPTACSCMNACTRTAPTNMRCFPITATIMRSHWHARLVLGSGRNMPRPLGHRTCEGPAETCCIDCHACAHNAKSVRCVARVARLYSFLHADLAWLMSPSRPRAGGIDRPRCCPHRGATGLIAMAGAWHGNLEGWRDPGPVAMRLHVAGGFFRERLGKPRWWLDVLLRGNGAGHTGRQSQATAGGCGP